MTITVSVEEEIWDYVYECKADEKTKFKDEKEIKKCCNDMYVIEKSGCIVCSNCGSVKSIVVLDDNVFSFANGDNNMYLRSFASDLYPVSSQATQISGTSKMARLQSWSSMPYNERVLWEVSSMLKSKLTKYISHRVINDTLILYKDFYEKTGIFRGDNKKGFIAVCVYIATTQSHASMTPKQISEILDVDLKVMYRCIQKYSEIMVGYTDIKKSSDFVEAFCNRIGLVYKLRKTINKILTVVEKYQILGGTIPQNTCISVIAFVCKEVGTPLDFDIITKEFSISMSTLEKSVATIAKEKQKIFKDIRKNLV